MTSVLRSPWPEIAGRYQRRILRPPAFNPQTDVLAQSGGGKDHLVRWGILQIFPLARVVLLVTKHGPEETWAADPGGRWGPWGNRVAHDELRPGFTRGPDGTPRYRVDLLPGRVTPKEADRLLRQLEAEGEMIVVIGDTSRLTDPPRRGGLDCEAIVSHMMAEGRGNGLTVIACANAAAWAAAGVKTQAAAVFLGRTGSDEEAAFADIAGLPKRNVAQGRGAERDALSQLPWHHWLYTDHADGPLFARITTPPPAGSWNERWPDP